LLLAKQTACQHYHITNHFVSRQACPPAFIMPIVNDVKDAASKAAQKARLNAEILLLNRKIVGRINAFGIEMYTHVAPMTESQDFYANDDDRLVQVLRPPLLTASKDIAALQNRFDSVTSQLEEAKVKRAGAFPVPAETAAEKIKNAGRATAMTANETLLRTELAVVQRQISGIQEAFGRTLYPTLAGMEDDQGWLPTDRGVRSIYDQSRREMDAIYKMRSDKLELLISLGGTETGLGINSSPNSRRPSVNGADGTLNMSSSNSGHDGSFSPPRPVSTTDKAGSRMRRQVDNDASNSSTANATTTEPQQNQWSEFNGTPSGHSTGNFDDNPDLMS
jgi:hypothetical protein